ncbi:MAG: hypothetical protein JW807_17265 [Spirochaetes bacterium]|nr:hypothetical protein [Spirochaetota bacterium]
MSGYDTGLKFSIKAHWAPLYINRKLIAGRVMPLHRMEEKLFKKIDGRGEQAIMEFFYSRYGLHCEPEDKKLTSMEFLKKNHFVSHAIVITYDKTLIVLGYNIFNYRFTKTNPRSGIYIDYFTSLPLNYPDNVKPSYLGRYKGDDTFYRVGGVGRATIALACHYAIDMHRGAKPAEIAVDLTARSDDSLIQDLYLKKYGFEFHKGKRGKDNDLYFTFQKARKFLSQYERSYKELERPEGNGLTYKDPFKY